MKFKLSLRVKFRAFNYTFKTVEKDWNVPVPGAPSIGYFRLVTFDEHGITLVASLA